MSLPRFYSRINDAIGPLLGSSAGDLELYLANKAASLEAPDELENHPVHLAGFVLAANLCARLYPRLRIVAPKRVVDQCASLALKINPACDIDTKSGACDASLGWEMRPHNEMGVAVSAAQWDVLVDFRGAQAIQPTNILTSLAAAAIGVGELFRTVFAQFLPAGRTSSSPGRLNILTMDDSHGDLPDLPSNIEIGRVHLAGAGAIGEAVIYALSRVAAAGTLVVVDPELVTLSNLQRYILTTDSDVGASKCHLVTRALKGSRIETVCLQSAWGCDPQTNDDVDTACVAVDTEATRIAIQAGLPRRIYNAWTQPADIGWSRHESFGDDPCLACLYWPTGPRPSQHQLISRAIQEHELRVLAYLTLKVPVDLPLRPEQIPRLPNMPIPANSSSWVDRSVLEDVADRLKIGSGDLAQWRGKQLSDLYREGICGGALLGSQLLDSREIAVPLAHQSVLAGIMLAAQLLIANSKELRSFRPTVTESRLNLLAGLPQISARPRQRSAYCICSDSDFVNRHREKWTQSAFTR